MTEQKQCDRCGKIMDKTINFYSSKNLEKYPDGKMNMCKKCLTAHIDVFDTTTFVPLLKEMDLPYVERLWIETLAKKLEKKTIREISGAMVFGSYLSRVRLQQWKRYSFKDSADINKMTLEELKEHYKNGNYSEEQIDNFVNLIAKLHNSHIIKDSDVVPEVHEIAETTDIESVEAPTSAHSENIITIDLSEDITEDEAKYLLIKWGAEYTVNEWIQLEKLWTEHMQSFDIQTASHKDYLKLICKASLRANQFINTGDIEGFNKVTKVYDQLMKSAKFTAAQNKEEKGDYVNCLSELVMIAEQDGPIPRQYVVDPRDKVDECLQDIKLFTKRLVVEETNLGELIEETLEVLKQEQEETVFFSGDDEDLEEEDIEKQVLQDLDYEEFYDELDKQKKEDDDGS